MGFARRSAEEAVEVMRRDGGGAGAEGGWPVVAFVFDVAKTPSSSCLMTRCNIRKNSSTSMPATSHIRRNSRATSALILLFDEEFIVRGIPVDEEKIHNFLYSMAGSASFAMSIAQEGKKHAQKRASCRSEPHAEANLACRRAAPRMEAAQCGNYRATQS